MYGDKCDFCGAMTGGRYRYIYPVPMIDGKNVASYFEGKVACMQCAIEQIALQREQGILEDVISKDEGRHHDDQFGHI